jgi:hypothetical protein
MPRAPALRDSGESSKVAKLVTLHHRRRGWAWVAVGSAIGLAVYAGIDVNLFGRGTGTAEALSVIPVFLLLGASGTLKYAAFDGSWSAPLTLQGGGVLDCGRPALTVTGSMMYASWDSQDTSIIEWASFNGAAWSKPQQVPHAMSLVGPGLAAYKGLLFDAWTPDIEGSPIDYSAHS